DFNLRAMALRWCAGLLGARFARSQALLLSLRRFPLAGSAISLLGWLGGSGFRREHGRWMMGVPLWTVLLLGVLFVLVAVIAVVALLVLMIGRRDERRREP
ncbi:MAG: hypothetical protein KDA71_24400, partial [Planctomycetales bacterium]|nr:hypothetical protein [Planctomycetales bacterium]